MDMAYDFKADQKAFVKVLDEASKLRETKLADYGPSYRNFGPLGVVVRLSDKMSRVERLMRTGKVNHESLRDSALDMLNYSCMLVMLLDEQNGGVK